MSIESILGATVVLALVIFVHELGHFLVAKWCDVEIHAFSMGFGPTLLSKRWGETGDRLSAIPFGGYVRMAGEDGADEPLSRPERGFAAKPIRQRAAIVAAGPGVNVLFAFLIFTAAFFVYGENVPVEVPKIGGVLADAPAAEARLQGGDVIKAVDGVPVTDWEDLANRVRASGGKALSMSVERAGQPLTIEVTPKARPDRDYLGEVIGDAYMIGIERALETRPVGFFKS